MACKRSGVRIPLPPRHVTSRFGVLVGVERGHRNHRGTHLGTHLHRADRAEGTGSAERNFPIGDDDAAGPTRARDPITAHASAPGACLGTRPRLSPSTRR